MPKSIPTTSAADFLSRKFDYLIIGGGTAGLAIAARLSENPSLTIGVLEAGPADVGIEAVDIPGLYGQILGSKYDWKFETEPQPGLSGRRLPWPRGKILGGTSALNFMTWNRACREDYDAWRDLGNEGWGWDDLLPYFQKSESFTIPDQADQHSHKLYYDEQVLGKSGPIKIGYATEYSSSHASWHDTMTALGVETNKAHMAGSNVGAWTNLGSVDPASGLRSYSTTAYYLPNASRPNLVLLTDAQVTEIVLEVEDGDWRAKGVRFQRDGDSCFIGASCEVIVSAGSVQSPQLLEQSGIGNPDILAQAGIQIKVANPNIGENLQDHIMAIMIFEIDPSLPTPDDLKHDTALTASAHQQFAASRSGPLAILPNSICYLPFSDFISEQDLHALAQKASHLDSIPDIERRIRQNRLEPNNPQSAERLGQMEFIFDLGNWNPYFYPPQPPPTSLSTSSSPSILKFATCLMILQHPFSRGSIHISTSRPATQPPVIDPKYYLDDKTSAGEIDLQLMVHAARFASERLSKTLPLAEMVRRRAFPAENPRSSTTISERGAEQERGGEDGGGRKEDHDFWRDWLKSTTVTDWHPVGTCAMGGRGGIKRGVVDERLRVYGTKGLRVVDASVMPMQISAHLQATVYAIAEKGAAMILEDDGLYC